MKRAMSLLLALAMVMSFFTVGSFAAENDGKTEATAKSMTVTASLAEVVVGGAVVLSTDVVEELEKTYEIKDLIWAWSVTDGTAVQDINAHGGAIEQTCNRVGEYTFHCLATATVAPKAQEGEAAPADETAATTETIYFKGEAPVKVVPDIWTMQLVERADTTKLVADANVQKLALVPGSTGKLTLDAKLYTTGEGAAEVTGVTYSGPKSNNTAVATVSGDTVTGVKGGSANIYVEVTYKGKTYEKIICTVTVGSIGVTATIPNGSEKTFSGTSSLFSAIETNLNSVMGTTTANKITLKSVTITPKASDIFAVKVGSATTAATSAFTLTSAADAVTIAAKAGYVDSEKWTYEAVDTNNAPYSGELTLKSDYAGTITEYQTADFSREWFYLDAITGIYEVRAYADTVKAYDATKVIGTQKYKVNYSREKRTTDWTESLIGYTTGKVAYKVDVKFTAAAYDVTGSSENGARGFVKGTDVLGFVNRVMYEQDYATYLSASGLTLESVEFTTSTDYTIYDGSTKVITSTYECKDLTAVSIYANKPGTLYIPFTANVKYKATSSSTIYTSKSYVGVLSVLITSEGDIQYEVSYNDTVTFDLADFQAFFKTASGKSNAKLTRVVFTDGQPLYGSLYTEPNKYTTPYMVTSSHYFYAAPTGTQDDLSKVTYLAASTPKTEYSVYIPFTAMGTGATNQSGVVEIIVNGKLPFTDIPETHTFYDYIKYVYREGIMNGKTSTTFDAKSNVTRIQLVRTLYRMAGSPTTYNYKTLSFVDAKSLSGEAANALKWAVNTGMVNGYGNVFKPNDAVTRQAMVTILYRFANFYGYDTTVLSSNNLAGFKDAAKVSKSMVEAMNWAVDCGFVSGTSGKMLNPGGSTTRGAAAKILATFHDWYIG